MAQTVDSEHIEGLRLGGEDISLADDVFFSGQRDRLYFISDAHLGSGSDTRLREKKLCRLLRRIQPTCKVLMLLGDMFDFWFSYRYLVPRGGVRLLGQLAQMYDDGVEIHFFIGNHDMWVFDYITEECGAILHNNPIFYKFNDRTMYVGHGDGLGHVDHGYDIMKAVFKSRLNQRLFAFLPSSLTFPIAIRWSENNKVRHRKQATKHYLGDDHEGIVIHCKDILKEHSADYCVFGHRHTPLIKTLSPTCTYVNVGDWLINRNFACYNPATDLLHLYNCVDIQ